jgi:cyanophycin synthetase
MLAAGVPAERILVIPDEQMATDTALREAQPGDLLLLFADAITRSWKQVIQFRPEAPARAVERPRPARPEPAPPPPEPALLDDRRREFVRDVRGVWLPREEPAD